MSPIDDSTLSRIDAIVDLHRVSLLFYSSGGARMVPLETDTPLVVGRVRPSDVIIPDMSLSRQHARFHLKEEEVWVEDLDSTNGVQVNGEMITQTVIKPGDNITLGTVTASIHFTGAVEPKLQGIDSHEQFLIHLENEVGQAKFFKRKLALLMVTSLRSKEKHLIHWYPRVRQLLRPVDRIALYSANAVHILMPNTVRDEAMALAQKIIHLRDPDDPPLYCGTAMFPATASSAEELIEVSREAAHSANSDQPVQDAAAYTAPLTLDPSPVIQSPAMIEVYNVVDRLARSVIPVLIFGETGVGKELVARAIHERGERQSKNLHCINCGAIPAQLMESALFGHERGAFTSAERKTKGVFEEAEGGTVLLDEIGELAPPAQAALLRVLEVKRITRVGSNKEIPVNVRILAATHCDLEAMCRTGTFRWDLLYRLNTMTLKVPPLRDRSEEILSLAMHFVGMANRSNDCAVKGISPEASVLLQRYSWPGNVRELRNIIERAVVVTEGEIITAEDLTDRLRSYSATSDQTGEVRKQRPTQDLNQAIAEGSYDPDTPTDGESLAFKDRVQKFERQLLLQALQVSKWNQTEAAKYLDMPLRTLVHKIKTYELKKKT